MDSIHRYLIVICFIFMYLGNQTHEDLNSDDDEDSVSRDDEPTHAHAADFHFENPIIIKSTHFILTVWWKLPYRKYICKVMIKVLTIELLNI